MSVAITSTRYFMAWLLSTVPSGASLRRMSGTVPADSISQLVKFFLPNWVAFAVNLSKLRFYSQANY